MQSYAVIFLGPKGQAATNTIKAAMTRAAGRGAA
jgi:hypothetical protein